MPDVPPYSEQLTRPWDLEELHYKEEEEDNEDEVDE